MLISTANNEKIFAILKKLEKFILLFIII